MTTIVTRSGKGSPLTHTEVDTNFTNLNTAKLETAAIPLGTLQAPSISFLNYSTTGIYSPAGDELGVSMLGSDKIRIKSTGEIIINATASRTTLGITPRLQIEGSASSSQCSLSLTGAGVGSSLIPRLYLSKARSSVNAVVLEDDILGSILFNGGDGSSLVNAGFIKAEVDGTPSAGIVPGRLVFATVDTAGGTGERMIIKNNGNVSIDGTTFHVDAVNNRVGIGTSSPGGKLDVRDAGTTIPALGAVGTGLNVRRTDGAIGLIIGYENTIGGSYIQAQHTNGSAAAYPLYLQPNGGNVGIGTTGPQGNLHVADAAQANIIIKKTGLATIDNSTLSDSYDNIQLGAGGSFISYNVETATADTYIGHNFYNHSAGMKYKYTDAVARIKFNSNQGETIFDRAVPGSANEVIPFLESMRIDSSGRLLVGTSTAVLSSKFLSQYAGNVDNGAILNETANTASTTFLAFALSGTAIGSVTRVGATSAVAYNTTSDYRLKTIVGSVTGQGERIDALKPIDFQWKENGEQARGFLAHEFQTVYANSVTGKKDAVDADGNPVYQAMQASTAEIIADLVAEIQSLRARVADLEAA